jgi:hypothetical protein
MRAFVRSTIFAIAMSAPVLAGALMDHSAVSVLGAPAGGTGPCNTQCHVGGAATGNGGVNSGGAANGGHIIVPGRNGLGSSSASGTFAVSGGQQTGHVVQNPTNPNETGTVSGNFTDPSNPHGHCTGGAGVIAMCS